MPNLENTIQVAARRAGESFLDSYELGPDAIPSQSAVTMSPQRSRN
jgi:hypothetical protein